MVSISFHVHPYFGKWSNLTNILSMGWNHQLVIYWLDFWSIMKYEDQTKNTKKKKNFISLPHNLSFESFIPNFSWEWTFSQALSTRQLTYSGQGINVQSGKPKSSGAFRNWRVSPQRPQKNGSVFQGCFFLGGDLKFLVLCCSSFFYNLQLQVSPVVQLNLSSYLLFSGFAMNGFL